MLVWPSQIGSSPQYGERPRGRAVDDGVCGSRYGCFTSLVADVLGSRTGTMSVLSSGDSEIGPFAFTRGLRLSLEIASCRYAFGVDHSHMLITTLRSRPCGRSGFAKGSSPAAMRSVQSANRASAFFGPSRPRVTAMLFRA